MNSKLAILAALVLTILPASAQQPSAAAIMESTRMSAALTKLDRGLNGKLQQGRTKVPITLFLMGQDIQFQYTEGAGRKIFHMRLGDDRCELFEINGQKRVRLTPARLTSPIAGTDLTYEDLSMRFLYWPNPELDGKENVGGQECYKIRIDKPPGTAGLYQTVYVWVHTKFGAFMRIRGHDKAGKLIKEFQVEDIMKVDSDVWTLRKMQVSTHNPANGRRTSITDVSMDTPRKTMGPRGLR